jgi:hypothetical protein
VASLLNAWIRVLYGTLVPETYLSSSDTIKRSAKLRWASTMAWGVILFVVFMVLGTPYLILIITGGWVE